MGAKVAEEVGAGKFERGILVCGTGAGMAPAPPAVPAGVTANLENDSETRAPVTGPSAWSPACRLAARSRAPCSSAIFFTTARPRPVPRGLVVT